MGSKYLLYFITFLGILLRLSFINKPEGLWNDEYVSWMVAATPFREGFWQEVLKQCHMPLYYFYLKPFAGMSDIVLRLTSVLPSIVAIIIMYFVGKEFSKKIGVFAVAITSFLSFLIYYAQEVRFYSLLFLFSAFSLLFTIRILKKADKLNTFGYVLSNLLILFTHVLGGIYVGGNIAYVLYKKKYISKKIILSFVVIAPVILYLGLNIINMLPSSQWWGCFSYTNMLFLFSDFLSPVLTNNVNAPSVFFYNSEFAIWLLLPTLIGLTGFVFGIKQFRGLNFIALMTIVVMSFLAIAGKLVFITKYAIEILPILILTMALGFVKLKKLGTALLISFLAFHLAFLFTPNYVTKIPRNEGHRLVAENLKKLDSQHIVFTYYEPNRFERYIDLKGVDTRFISKINRFDYQSNPARILENIKQNETVTVVILDSVSFFDKDFLDKNLGNTSIPEMFLTFSLIKQELLRELDENYTDFKVINTGAWTLVKAKKK